MLHTMQASQNASYTQNTLVESSPDQLALLAFLIRAIVFVGTLIQPQKHTLSNIYLIFNYLKIQGSLIGLILYRHEICRLNNRVSGNSLFEILIAKRAPSSSSLNWSFLLILQHPGWAQADRETNCSDGFIPGKCLLEIFCQNRKEHNFYFHILSFQKMFLYKPQDVLNVWTFLIIPLRFKW